MVISWIKCSLTSTGLIQAESGSGPWLQVSTETVLNGTQYDVASLQVELSNGSAAWTSATLELKWANRDVGTGPWYAHTTPATIATGDHIASKIEIEGQYLGLICTAAEAGVFVDVYLHLRKVRS
jgi:hypothetical protein